MKLDMQFLDHHRKQFLDLHADWAKSNIRHNRKPHWQISKHSSCSKSSYCPATTMIGLLLLSRVVVRPALFFLPDPHTMMQTNQERRLWPRLKVRPRRPQTPQAAAAGAARAATGAEGASPFWKKHFDMGLWHSPDEVSLDAMLRLTCKRCPFV